MAAINDGPYTLTIANAGTTSGSLSTAAGLTSLRHLMGALIGFTIFAPAALTGTVSVEVSYDGSNWLALADSGTDVTVAANRATAVRAGGFRDIRLVSSGAEAAERSFTVLLQFDVSK